MDSPTVPAPPRPRRPLDAAIGAIVGLIATILGLIVLAWAILFVTKGRFLKPTFVKYASRYAERAVAVEGDFQFYFNPFHLKFLAQGLTLANPAWAHDRQLFTARLIDTEISTFDLIFGRQHVLFLTLDGANAGLEIDKAGRNTWTFAGDTPFKLPPIDRAAVTGSTLHYLDAKHRGRRPADLRRSCRVGRRARESAGRRPADLPRRRDRARRAVHHPRRADDAELDDDRGADRRRSPRQRRADRDRRRRDDAGGRDHRRPPTCA